MFKDSTSLKVGDPLEVPVAPVELLPVLLAYEDIEKKTDTRESTGRSEILPLLRYKGRLGILMKSSRWKRKGVFDASYIGTAPHK